MKTLKNISDSVVKRVSDDKASVMVKEGWSYCPKAEWKTFKGVAKSPADKKNAPKEDKSEEPDKNISDKEISKREQKRSRWKKGKGKDKKICEGGLIR